MGSAPSGTVYDTAGRASYSGGGPPGKRRGGPHAATPMPAPSRHAARPNRVTAAPP